jgi:hypothetical protein
MSELRYLYTNKNVSPLNTLNLISGWYWSEIYFLDANYGRIAMLVKMSDGTRAGNYGSNSNYSVCIYD